MKLICLGLLFSVAMAMGQVKKGHGASVLDHPPAGKTLYGKLIASAEALGLENRIRSRSGAPGVIVFTEGEMVLFTEYEIATYAIPEKTGNMLKVLATPDRKLEFLVRFPKENSVESEKEAPKRKTYAEVTGKKAPERHVDILRSALRQKRINDINRLLVQLRQDRRISRPGVINEIEDGISEIGDKAASKEAVSELNRKVAELFRLAPDSVSDKRDLLLKNIRDLSDE